MRSTLKSISLKLAFTLVMMATSVQSFAQSPLTIYFYNPEININRNSILKHKFDQFLATFGNYQFQPVSDQATFEHLVRTENQALFMMSSWLFHSFRKELTLEAQLVGMKNGSIYYKKLLVLNKDTPITDLANITIASAGTKKYSLAVLKGMQSSHKLSNIHADQLLIVPKDVDALLAVGFGMAQGALSTEDSFDQLKTLYQNQYDQLTVVGRSQVFPRLTVVASNKPSKHQEKLITLINQMSETPSGKIPLSILGLDNWKHIDNADTFYQSGLQISQGLREGRKP